MSISWTALIRSGPLGLRDRALAAGTWSRLWIECPCRNSSGNSDFVADCLRRILLAFPRTSC